MNEKKSVFKGEEEIKKQNREKERRDNEMREEKKLIELQVTYQIS